ncbi:MAG: hypothetical protein MRJ96_09115 [Nitrospirales bacterium]|nr:hypothetical protein [Nitrospira sp.]MDR4501592.1 hypothetical protein [Nitrospirales bacterium]
MTDDIMQAYLDVEKAMQHYTTVLNEYVATLQATPDANKTKLERMKAGTRAMQDSSGIYLSYAKFVAYGMPESEELIEDDIQT